MLRVIIRRSAVTHRDLDSYVGQLEGRLDAIASAQAKADQTGSVGLHNLVADELLHFGVKEDERVIMFGPEVELRPRAGQVLALAVHELAVNAVEHGALWGSAGVVDVAWSVKGSEAGSILTISWKETGMAHTSEARPQGFGTEVLTRMVAYELKASGTMTFEEDGLHYILTMPLTPEIGEVPA